jgi:peptidoglycan hydrolase-like protein with peptidoglycan-binding domain
VQLVTRAQLGWPESEAPIQATTLGVKVHYEGTTVSTGLLSDHGLCIAEWKNIRLSHLANTTENYSDIAYSYGACPHGYLLEGRGIGRRTGANGNQPLNRAHYAIVGLVGDKGLTSPTPPMLHAIRDGIELLRQHGAGQEIKGHRDGYATSCPGGPLYAWVQAGAPRPGGATPAPAPTPQPPAKSTPPPSAYATYDGRPLRNFTQTTRVQMWQAYMAWRGWRLTVDGRYGDASEAVCRAFQTECNAEGYPVGAVDGVVGARTWAATKSKPVTR